QRVKVEAAEGQESEGAARQRSGAPVRRPRLRQLPAQLVHAADALPDVARRGVQVARLDEGRERGGEVAAPEEQLAAAGERGLGPDGGRVAAGVEPAAGV